MQSYSHRGPDDLEMSNQFWTGCHFDNNCKLLYLSQGLNNDHCTAEKVKEKKAHSLCQRGEQKTSAEWQLDSF